MRDLGGVAFGQQTTINHEAQRMRKSANAIRELPLTW